MASGLTPLTYNGYVTQIATMAVVNTTTVAGVVQGVDDAFNAIIPQMLNYAEQRIMRDIDLLSAVTSKDYTLTINANMLSVSSNDFETVQTIAVNSAGTVYPMLPVTKEYLQNVYNSSTFTGRPAVFAMYGGDASTGGNTSSIIMMGPTPDDAYSVTITGTVNLPTLYQNATTALAGTATTYISTNLPDMLVMASMIYISAYQRNFGRMSDDPAMAQSYEAQYMSIMKATNVVEQRKKFGASAWSSMSIPDAATSTR